MKGTFFWIAALALLASCGGCDDNEPESNGEFVAFSDVEFEICGNGQDDDSNGLVDCADRICQLDESCRFVPANPSEFAKPSTAGNLSSFYEQVKFLVEGEQAVVRAVDLERLNRSSVSVARGRILDRDGEPLSGVRARIAGAPEYGYTFSRSDGWVDFVVNSGEESVVIRFDDQDVLPVDISVELEENAFANGRDVVATSLDSVVNVVQNGQAILQTRYFEFGAVEPRPRRSESVELVAIWRVANRLLRL